MGFSGHACKNVQCGGGSRARAPGAQQVWAIVAPLAPLEARRRDLSPNSPNGARRRCPTAGRRTLNLWFVDEYGSSPLYSSGTGPFTPYSTSCASRLTARPLALVMIGDALPRATRDGTSPTGLSGSRGEPQGVGATSSGGSYSTVMLCIHPVQGPGANGPVAGGPPGR